MLRRMVDKRRDSMGPTCILGASFQIRYFRLKTLLNHPLRRKILQLPFDMS